MTPPHSDRDRRRKAEALGIDAERLAAFALRLKLYRLVARRFRTPVGEIDLVMKRGSMLVFVEVKARTQLAAAAEAVDVRTRRRIVQASERFVQMNPRFADADRRFDVMLVCPGRWPVHIQNAFFADD